MKKTFILLLSTALIFASCSKDEDPQPTANNNGDSGPNLIFKLYFDSTYKVLHN